MSEKQEQLLLGTWDVDPHDLASVKNYGKTTLDFKPDGKLIYTEHVGTGKEVSILTYRIDGKCIVTDQPSQPREAITGFEFDDDGRLILWWGGVRSVYVRRER